MKMQARWMVPALLCVAAAAQAAQTNLQARDLDPNLPGYEAVYDSARNITWLADADVLGLATWSQQSTWAGSLQVGTFGGWQLADIGDLQGLYADWWTASAAEFGADWLLDPSHPGSDAGMGSQLFSHWHDGTAYWTSNTGSTPDSAAYLVFDRIAGDGGEAPKDYPWFKAWAVHAGDIGTPMVGVVPEPQTYALLLAGLLALAARRAVRRS